MAMTTYDAPLNRNKWRRIGSVSWPLDTAFMMCHQTASHMYSCGKYPFSVFTYLSSRNHFEPVIEVKKEIDCIWYVVTLRAEC